MKFQSVPDYHMHTPRCNHACGTIREYAEAAVAAGLTEIGISDHSPMPGDFDAAWRMRREELDDYLQEAEACRDAFAGNLTIRIGLEADYHPGTENYVADMIAAYDWDYVIGSVHYIGDWGFDNPDTLDEWDRRNIDDAYCDYFNLVAQSAATGMFDIIGHPDLIKKFGHRPTVGNARVLEAQQHMLQAVQQSDTALEISSAGLRKPVGEIYPHTNIVKEAARLNIPFVYGSDAHAPAEVGHGMNECLALLHEHEVREIASFRQRQRHMQAFCDD